MYAHLTFFPPSRVCFGATPEGVDFATSFVSTGIKKEFIQYLK
jgi:hypothetical protein